MYIRIFEPDFQFSDERGQLIQLVHEGYKQVNYIFSYAGEFRGGHYHRRNKELFYIIGGKLELKVWPVGKADCKYSECYIFGTGDMFEIPENIVHSFYFLETTSLISLYTNGVESESGEKDIIKGVGSDGLIE